MVSCEFNSQKCQKCEIRVIYQNLGYGQFLWHIAKRSWQYCHSCIVESLWNPRMEIKDVFDWQMNSMKILHCVIWDLYETCIDLSKRRYQLYVYTAVNSNVFHLKYPIEILTLMILGTIQWYWIWILGIVSNFMKL